MIQVVFVSSSAVVAEMIASQNPVPVNGAEMRSLLLTLHACPPNERVLSNVALQGSSKLPGAPERFLPPKPNIMSLTRFIGP